MKKGNGFKPEMVWQVTMRSGLRPNKGRARVRGKECVVP